MTEAPPGGTPGLPRHALIILAAIVAAGFLLRVFPYLSSGFPYHTDTFPQLANVRNLVSRTPVPLSPSGGFDSYNIYWPADALFFAVTTVLLGAPPVASMPIVGPFVTSLTAVLFFALVRSFGLSARTSAIAALLFEVAGGTVMISTGVTKEGFAIPLMVLVLLLLNLWLRDGRKGALGLSAVAFGVLLAAHSLTSVVGLLLASYLAMAYVVVPGGDRRRVGATVGVLSLFAVVSYLYFYVYAVSNLPYPLQPSDVIAVFGYEVLLTAPVWLAGAFRSDVFKWAGAWMGVLALGVSGLFGSALAFHFLLDSPVVSPYVIALAAPYLAVAFLASAGARLSGKTPGSRGAVFASLWALGILGMVGFSVFSTPGVIGTTMRILDFVYPGAAILGAAALSLFIGSGKARAAAGIAVLGVLVVGSAYVVPYSAYWSGPIGGSQRVFSQAEASALGWTERAPANVTVSGDVRLSLLASYYTGEHVSSEGEYLFLAGVGGPPAGCMLVDRLIFQVGFIGGTYGLPVNSTTVGTLSGQPALQEVYSNGEVWTYCHP
ncbi:MAG: hypothetical protein JRN21_04790 [Nitrososphaerota archaeon]|nr:hypothetical protein [Nitrososphaerota archaeon]